MPQPQATPSTRYELAALPYALDALEPVLSKETLQYHHGRHHKAYVDKLNALVEGSAMAGRPLEEVIGRSTGALFNNAAQVWNHDFYFAGMAPNAGGDPQGELGKLLKSSFGSLEKFRETFRKHAVDNFGSGWTWLVKTRDGQLVVRNTDDADNPLRSGDAPLLACDVWEHAYYIDYRNERPRYVDAFWNVVNWDVVVKRFARAG
jgi:Fe-Mn family superoxide dismutase